MAARILMLGVALVSLAFGLVEWQKNVRLHQDLAAVRALLAEREAAQERRVVPVVDRENPDLVLARSRNAALTSRVKQLEAELVVARRLHDAAATNNRSLNPPLATTDEESADQLAAAVLPGDFKALDSLAEMARKASSANHPNMTADEQEKRVANLRPIWAAFDTLAEEASQGNQSALQALAKAARMPDLSGLAIKSLGELAAKGSAGALNIVLDPQQFGIDVPFASTVGALKSAAAKGNPRAIGALAAVAADDTRQPLWFMAADGLRAAAAAGDTVAIEALISFSRSTNQNVLNAVRAGLGAAAANQNARAIEALRNLSAGKAGPAAL